MSLAKSLTILFIFSKKVALSFIDLFSGFVCLFVFSVSFIYFCFHLYDTVSSTNLSFVRSFSASFKCKVAFRLLTLEFQFSSL